MQLTDQNLYDIESWAECLMGPTEVALIVGLDKHEFLNEVENEDSEVYRAYQKGKLKTEGKLRRSVIDMASQGSSPAQALLDKWIENDKLENSL